MALDYVIGHWPNNLGIILVCPAFAHQLIVRSASGSSGGFAGLLEPPTQPLIAIAANPPPFAVGVFSLRSKVGRLNW